MGFSLKHPSPSGLHEGQAAAKRSAAEAALLEASVTLREAARVTGASEDRIQRLIRRGGVLAFSVDGSWRIPAWQLQPSEIAPAIPAAVAVADVFPGDLGALNDWIQRPNVDLSGSSPLEALKGGREARVAALARSIGAAGR